MTEQWRKPQTESKGKTVPAIFTMAIMSHRKVEVYS